MITGTPLVLTKHISTRGKVGALRAGPTAALQKRGPRNPNASTTAISRGRAEALASPVLTLANASKSAEEEFIPDGGALADLAQLVR